MCLRFNFHAKIFRIWYWYISKIDKNADILFMNYGYHHKDQQITIDEQNEHNRYSIQLYHQLASSVEIRNKDIVEIGCGRGGGLAFITSTFAPASAIGIDVNKLAISFCNHYYNLKGLSFLHGDAHKLPLESNICDIVINVESSHRYTDMNAFLKEVFRILRPGGYFLFTDFRRYDEIENLKRELKKNGMIMVKERIINQEVVSSLNLDNTRKHNLIKKLAPRFLHKVAQNFATIVGSETYNNLVSKKFIYFSYVLRKP